MAKIITPAEISHACAKSILNSAGEPPDITRLVKKIEMHYGAENSGRRMLFLVLMAACNISIGEVKPLGGWQEFPGGKMSTKEVNALLIAIVRENSVTKKLGGEIGDRRNLSLASKMLY